MDSMRRSRSVMRFSSQSICLRHVSSIIPIFSTVSFCFSHLRFIRRLMNVKPPKEVITEIIIDKIPLSVMAVNIFKGEFPPLCKWLKQCYHTPCWSSSSASFFCGRGSTRLYWNDLAAFFNDLPERKVTRAFFILAEVNSSGVSVPSLDRPIRKLPRSPRKTDSPRRRAFTIHEIAELITARTSPSVTVHIFSTSLQRSSNV